MGYVTCTHFVPGTEVGLYGIVTRPRGIAEDPEPLERATVPEGGQLSFETGAAAGQAFWLGGLSVDGRWHAVQAFARDGEPVDVREKLTETRPADPLDLDERRVRGARGTRHVHPRFLRKKG